MSKTAKDNIIQINGEKFKALLEGATGKTLKEISLENGFSDSFLRMVVKTCKASPSAQAVAKLYGIEPSAYEIKPEVLLEAKPENKTDGQLSIDDLLGNDAKRLLKEFINQSVEEAFTDFIYNNQFAFIQSPIDQTFRVVITKKPELAKDPDRFSI